MPGDRSAASPAKLVSARNPTLLPSAPAGEIHIDHTRFGAGYGKPTPECLEALRTTARLEGLILDPVYTGKAMAGLIGWIREGRFTDQHSVLFWHTGGAPALFAGPYNEWLTSAT